MIENRVRNFQRTAREREWLGSASKLRLGKRLGLIGYVGKRWGLGELGDPPVKFCYLSGLEVSDATM